MCTALDAVVTLAPRAVLLARAFCLLRTIRGAAGVEWAARQLSDPDLSDALLRCPGHEAVLQHSAARLVVLAEMQAVTGSALAHREGIIVTAASLR